MPTKRVLQAAERLLEYAAQYPNHQLVYHACDTVLHIQSDASFLSRSECRSVAGGVHYLGNKDGHGCVRYSNEVLGYAQPATRILCDNQCVADLATNTVKARSSKSIDMRFHWIRGPAHRHRELKPLLVRVVPDPANPSLPKQL